MNFFQAPALYSLIPGTVPVTTIGSTTIHFGPVVNTTIYGPSASVSQMVDFVEWGNGVCIAHLTSRSSNGTANFLRSSDLGATWTTILISVGGTTNLDRSCLAYGNGVWLYSGMNVVFQSLDDGVTWTNVTATFSALAAGGTGKWAFKYANGTWVASMSYNSANAATNKISSYMGYSIDGINWTATSAPIQLAYSVIEYIPDTNVWYVFNGTQNQNGAVVTVSTATTTIQSTDNGVTWSAVASGSVITSTFSSYYFNNKWVLQGTGATSYTIGPWDALWDRVQPTTPPGGYTSYFNNGGWCILNGSMVLPYLNGTTYSFQLSPDGATWQTVTTLDTTQAAGKWLIVGSNGVDNAIAFSGATTTSPIQTMRLY